MRKEDAFTFTKPKRRHLSIAFQQELVVVWDKTDSTTVEKARQIFQKYVKQGWLAFQVTPEGHEIQMSQFNPTLKKIILVPLEGGG